MTKKYTYIILFLFSLFGCKPSGNRIDISQEVGCIYGQSSCQLSTQFGEVKLGFNTKFLVAETPFEMHLLALPNELSVTSAHMAGEDMYMGKIPLFFKQVSDDGWAAHTMFGSCAQAQMTWRVWLTLESAIGETQTVSFTVQSFQSFNAIPEDLL
ncbi:hypothetical protein [Thalassotalea montiporae]